MDKKDKSCWKNAENKLYPFVILFAGIIIYYILVYYQFLEKPIDATWKLIVIIISHFLLFMTIWCYLVTYFTDPGKPPVFWVY